MDILNYTKDGVSFMNNLQLRPLRSASGAVRHYLGCHNSFALSSEEELSELSNSSGAFPSPGACMHADEWVQVCADCAYLHPHIFSTRRLAFGLL